MVRGPPMSAGLVVVTLTSGATAPDESVTVPPMEPVRICPRSGRWKSTASTKRQTQEGWITHVERFIACPRKSASVTATPIDSGKYEYSASAVIPPPVQE